MAAKLTLAAVGRLEEEKRPLLAYADRLIREARAAKPKPLTKAQKRRARLAARTPLTGRELGLAVAEETVDNPHDVGPEKIRVEVNKRVDILAEELAHRRISKAAFMTGRELQGIFELADRRGGRDWAGGDRVDAAAAHEHAIAKAIETATVVEAELGRLRKAVGEVGARFLREILTGTTYAQYAARRGQGGERGANFAGRRFRQMLEDVTEFRAAKAGAAKAPRDRYAAMAKERRKG